MGNNTAWRTEHGAVYFPNPLRQPNARRKNGKTYRYKRGTEFPVPHGAGWDRFMRDRLGGTPGSEDNAEHNELLTLIMLDEEIAEARSWKRKIRRTSAL